MHFAFRTAVSRLRHPIAYLIALLSIAALLSALPGSKKGPVGATPAEARPLLAAPDIAGDWEGAWIDTVFSVVGDMTFSIHRDGNSWFATGTIDVSGINPLMGTLSGSATGSSPGDAITGTFTCMNLGSGNFTITSIPGQNRIDDATASGSGTVGAPLGFGPFTFTGNVVGDLMEGGFDFTNPGGGKGIALMSKTTAVTPTTWTAFKQKYAK